MPSGFAFELLRSARRSRHADSRKTEAWQRYNSSEAPFCSRGSVERNTNQKRIFLLLRPLVVENVIQSSIQDIAAPLSPVSSLKIGSLWNSPKSLLLAMSLRRRRSLRSRVSGHPVLTVSNTGLPYGYDSRFQQIVPWRQALTSDGLRSDDFIESFVNIKYDGFCMFVPFFPRLFDNFDNRRLWSIL